MSVPQEIGIGWQTLHDLFLISIGIGVSDMIILWKMRIGMADYD